MLRRLLVVIAALLGIAHLAAYLASGWVARTVLVNRTLDGERQPPERWTALLHEMLLRSGVVSLVALGVILALVTARRTREELVAFWYAEDSPRRLGVFRAIFFALFFVVFDADQTIFFARLPPVLVQGLPDPLPLWRLIVPAPALTVVLVKVFLGLCFLGMIGLFTRFAALGVAVTGFYLLGLPQIYGKVDHYHHLLWFSLVLALSPSGDAFSVDALVRRWLDPASAPAPKRSRAYGLPIRLIWVMIGVIYFWPGFWKVVQHGPAWVLAENFKAHLYLKWFEEPTFTPLFRIDHHPWMCTMGSTFAICFELSWIFLIPFARTRPFAIAAGLLFHNMTFALMNIAFLSLQICYAVFVDWDAVLRRIEQRRRGDAGTASEPPALERRLAAIAPVAALLRLLTSAPSERAAVRGLAAAAAVILGFDMAYGALHQTDGWPFACYPTFSTIIKREHRSLYVKIESPSGADREAESDKAIDAFRSERYAAVLYGVVHERDEARRRRKLEALASVIRAADRSIKPGETIVIGEALFSTDPEAGRRPRADERLHAYLVRDESTAWQPTR